MKCVDETCKCDEKWQFWDLLKGMCMDYLTYDAGDCKEDSHCEGNLVCRITSSVNSCECPLSVALNKCDCKREIGDEWFWGGSDCVPTTGYDRACLNSSTSYECKTLTEGTECIKVGNSFACKCPPTKYFNFDSFKCEDLIGNTTSPCKQSGKYHVTTDINRNYLIYVSSHEMTYIQLSF